MSREIFAGAVPIVIFVAKATLLLIAALVGTASLRRGTAGARHLVWLAALVGVLALPLLSHVPALRIGILPADAASGLVVDDSSRMAVAAATAPDIAVPSAPEIAGARPAVLPVPASAPAASAGAPHVAGFAATALPSTIGTTLAIVWAGVALSLLAWLLVGAVQVRRIVAAARELASPDWTTPLCEVADRLDLEEPPRLVMSGRIEMAFACRAFAPTVVLPAVAESWSDDRRRAVLFHELAHVKRHDLLGHALGRVACALYWFHPLVWTAAKNLRNESERACDDLVLSCGAKPSEYAQHLLDMVTSVRRHGAPIMALPMARKKEFEGRMLAILDPAVRRASPGRLQATALVATLGALSLSIAAVTPVAARQTKPVPASRHSIVEGAAGDTAPRIAPPVATIASAPAPVPATPSASASTEASEVAPAKLDMHTETKTVASAKAQAVLPRNDGALGTIMSSAIQLGLNEAAKALTGELRSGRLAPVQQADTGRIALLSRLLASDSDATVRRTAAWALHDVRTTGAHASLVHALQSDASADVREMSAWALAEYDSDDIVNALATALRRDTNARVRATSAWALGSIERGSSAADALAAGAADSDDEVRAASIWALGQLGLRQAPRSVVAALGDASPRVRTVAAWTLGEIRDATAMPALTKAFESETTSSIRIAALHSMAEIGTVPASVIDAAMQSKDPEVRRRGVQMLAGGDQSWPWPWPWPRPRPSP